jgi:protein-tyrosine sulfotransferase
MAATDKMYSPPDVSRTGPQNARVVFILGIAERSGTNYLQDILRLHPDCDVDGMELEEDHFTHASHFLVNFVQLATRSWKRWWGPEYLETERELLYRCIGDGLISFLKKEVVTRRLLNGIDPNRELKVLVTKTPSTENLDLFFRIFPDAELIILVRDGRAVVESAVRTFYRRFDRASRQWADRANAVLRFTNNDANHDRRYLLVKYEDLYSHNQEEMRRILDFLHLDQTRYDFTAAANLPVRGSSTLRQEDTQIGASPARGAAPGIHWRPVAKSADFNPLARWSHWTRAQHERFNWIAGMPSQALGYESRLYTTNRRFWTAWNWLLDILPVESAVWLSKRVGHELKGNPNKLKALRSLTTKVWRRLRPPAGMGNSSA